MKITKLWFENFRTLKGHYDVPLDDSTVNLFVANVNGAGKSSVFFGVYYMLCGYVSGKTQDEYVNWDCDSMSCGMEFEFQTHQFKIECSYKKGTEKTPGKADKNLWIDKEEFNGVTGCNKKLKEYFDPNLFIGSSGLFQNSKNFTSVKDSERRDNLKKVFNLDYSDDIKILEKDEKDKEQEVVQLEKQLAIYKSKTFQKKDLLTQKISKEEYISITEKITSIESQIQVLNIQIASIDQEIQKKKSLEAQIVKENKNIELYQTSIDKAVQEVSEARKFDSIPVIQKIESLTDELNSIKLERVKAFEESKITDVQQKISNTNADIRSLQKELNDCKSGICPTCHKEHTTDDVTAITSKIEKFSQEKKSLEDELAVLKDEKIAYEKIVEENNTNRSRKEVLEVKIENEKRNLNLKLESITNLISQKSKEIDEKSTLRDEATESIKTLNKEFSEIEIKDSQNLKVEIYNLTQEKDTSSRLIREYDSIESQNKLIESQNKQLELDEVENTKNIETTQVKIDSLTLDKQQLSKMKFFLKKEFPSYVISTMIKQIQDNMNEFISTVYYKDLNVEIDGDDDNISVLYGTGKNKVDAINASGAEESLLALSYCYALNKLKNYNVLFIDEIDSPLTEDGALKLAEMISKIKSEYDFIGIISHVKSVQDYFGTNEANVVEMEQVC